MNFKQLLSSGSMLLALAATAPVHAEVAPDALVRQISIDVIDTAKADKAIQAGDQSRVVALVDAKVMCIDTEPAQLH